MRARLIGDHIDGDAPANDLGQDLGGVPDEADRPRGAFAAVALDLHDRIVERRSDLIDEAL